jgi:Ser/Thr protein kinase RdoA (MazF antagonist)
MPIDPLSPDSSRSPDISRIAPATHSTIDPDFVARLIEDRYDHAGPVAAELLYRGVNDVYIIKDANGRRAMRIWRAATRSVTGVMQELDYLDFLDSHGIPLSKSIPARNGDRYIIVNALEGLRPAVLYTWAPGSKFGDSLDIPTAERIGGKFAEMHLIARDYQPAQDVVDDPIGSLRENLPSLLLWVSDRPDDIRDYTHLTETLSERLKTLDDLDLPRGMCHQDMHPSNVHLSPDGTITFLDFDGCSVGYWLHDVKNFIFGSAFYGFDAAYGAAFERGYLRVRPYTADEIESQELFLLNKAFRLVGGASRGSSSRGRDLLRLQNLNWFAEYIKPRARSLGLL